MSDPPRGQETPTPSAPRPSPPEPRRARAPRRPAGWIAPGPPPRGSQGRPELEAAADEELSYLAGDWRVFQKRRGHRWSLDDLVTAAVAAEEVEANGLDGERMLDLGCGQGSVLLLLAWRFPRASLWGLEVQSERAAMARRSIAFNGVEGRVRVLTGDLREGLTDEGGAFLLVTGTPPYFPRGTGVESEKAHAAPCRFELKGGVEAYLEGARRRLAPPGRLVLCSPALAEARVDAAAEDRGLHLARRVRIIPREGKAPLLQVDVFSARPQSAPVVSHLVVRDRALQWTPEFRDLRAAFGMPTEPPTLPGAEPGPGGAG